MFSSSNIVKHFLSTVVAKQSFSNKTTNNVRTKDFVANIIQQKHQNTILPSDFKTICGPIFLPLTADDSSHLRLKSTCDDQNNRYLHLVKNSNNCEHSFPFIFPFKNDAYLFLRSIDILNDECKNTLKGIIECCNSKSKQNPSSRILYKSSGFVSIKGLYLLGLVWHKNENQLFCEIKFINGINKFSNSQGKYRPQTLEFHCYQLNALRGAIYHLVYGWNHTNLLGSKSGYNDY